MLYCKLYSFARLTNQTDYAGRCHTCVKFCLREVGGGKKPRCFWHRSAKAVGAYVFVIDSARRDRFPEAFAALKFFLKQKEVPEKPLVVFANKQVSNLHAHRPENIKSEGSLLSYLLCETQDLPMAASRFEIEKSLRLELGELLPSNVTVCSTTALPEGELKAGDQPVGSAAAATGTAKDAPVAFPAETAKEDLLEAMDTLQRAVLRPKQLSGGRFGGGKAAASADRI